MINVQNIDDNECFKLCLVRYLNPVDRNTQNFQSKLETFTKLKKKSIGISVFRYENKEKHPIFISKKCCEQKHDDLLLIKEKGKRYFIKDLNKFMNNLDLHARKNIFVVIAYKLLVQKKY